MRITLRPTSLEDLPNLKMLWNTACSMTQSTLLQGNPWDDSQLYQWYRNMRNDRALYHYSIYSNTHQYCGEVYFRLKSPTHALVEVSLLHHTQGEGIATQSLHQALAILFSETSAQYAFTLVESANRKTIHFYERFGFAANPHMDLDPETTYLEISKELWMHTKELERCKWVKVELFVPAELADLFCTQLLRLGIGKKGSSSMGIHLSSSLSIVPTKGSSYTYPGVGIETSEQAETKLEFRCKESQLSALLQLIETHHPHSNPTYYILPLLNEEYE